MQENFSPDACKTTMICVDSYCQGNLVGRFYNLGLQSEGCTFHSLTQLLVGIEHILNSTNSPQSYTALRTFAPLPSPPAFSPPEGTYQKGELATFMVRILFRQHTSWQGTVTWLDRGEQTFRSVLELILLMDSALGGCHTELPIHPD